MLNYIVLGQIPGTDHYLSFTSVLIMYALVFLTVVIISSQHLMYGLPPRIKPVGKQRPKKFSDTRITISSLLAAACLPLAIWIIMRYSAANRQRLQNYLSNQNPA